MPVVSKSTSIAANSQNDNILTGSAFEYLPGNARIAFGIVQATGNTGDLLCTVQSGSDILMEESPLIIRAGMAITPDDFNLQDVALGGERLLVKVRNTTAGAIVVNTTVKIDLV